MDVPHWVLTHAQEYMFFDLTIQALNSLLLMLVVFYLMKINRSANAQKK
ncbi:MAG: hypothetical protein GX608_07155 [Lentisphaerae bacterium]|nr:hypothetical protein [Lentisphaerota bacterium]